MVKSFELARGINRLGRSQTISRKKRYLHFGKGPQKKVEKAEDKKEEKKDEKTQKKATRRFPRWYAADDIPTPLKSRKHHRKPTKLRNTITPGTNLIILAGRYKGKRVVFLKQLNSGLLLVTGPFKINGVPLRRINQTYVIATSTKLNISSIDVSDIRESLFKKKAIKAKLSESKKKRTAERAKLAARKNEEAKSGKKEKKEKKPKTEKKAEKTDKKTEKTDKKADKKTEKADKKTEKKGDKKEEPKKDESKKDDASKKTKRAATKFFKKPLSAKSRITRRKLEAQKRIDTALISLITAVPNLKHYLNAKFSLTNGVFPHAIKF